MSESWGPALFGYASQFSVAPGDSISFHVSGEDVERYTAQLVRLRHGLDRPDGPGFRESEIASAIDGEYPAVRQPDNSGSYVEVPDPDGLLSRSASLHVSLDMFPTLLDERLQGVLGTWDVDRASGYALVIEDRRLALWVGDGSQQTSVVIEKPLQPHTWYRVQAGFDP
jgi:N,N-dimethylformamidase